MSSGKTEKMSFFKKMGSNNSSSNNQSSNSNSGSGSSSSSIGKKKTTTTSSSSSSSSSSTAIPTSVTNIKSRSQSTDGLGNQSWIFNLKITTYKKTEAKVGSKVKLNIKNRQDAPLKKGDRFFFSISTPNKQRTDRIVSQSTVIQDPQPVNDTSKGETERTYDVLVQFEKIFLDPIPRTIFESHPVLSDLAHSKGSFTKIPDSQLSLFLDMISNYSTKTVKKEAMSFLTGISLGENNSKKNDNNSNTPILNINPSIHSTPLKEPISLDRDDTINNNKIDSENNINNNLENIFERDYENNKLNINDKEDKITDQTNQPQPQQQPQSQQFQLHQQPQQQQQHNLSSSPNSLPPNLLSQIQQRSEQQQKMTNQNMIPPQPHLQYQQPPPKHQISQLQLQSQDFSTKKAIIKKRNTIEEYNANYNLSVQQKIVFVTPSGHPISVFSLIKGESRKTRLKTNKKDHYHHGDYSGIKNKENLNSINSGINVGGISGGNNNNNDNGTMIGNINGSSSDGQMIVNGQSGVGGGGNFYLTKESILNNLGLIGKKEISYAHLLVSENDNDLVGDELDCNGVPLKYDPTFLDNSELKTGKHRTVMNLPSYKVSIFPFIKKGAIKEELNEQFRQKHQWINQPGITLYKIRKIKRKLKKITIQSSLEISTLGLAYVLIEKLIMKNLISRSNFKLVASTCLLLAAKFNDTKAMENALGPFFEQVEKRFDISKKEVLASEFSVFSQLSFTLFVSQFDVLPHLNRLKSEAVEDEELIF
ncbi:hypothetical protein RB653_001948 [Dictyostelium firmibasis]|uniref:Cyclin-like domain-containing protein n=1 Tax=Dictyostelium firmibasis TaxID=79012 RepID=A0AAN7YS77_9MYCE